jgi:hypothetical protein
VDLSLPGQGPERLSSVDIDIVNGTMIHGLDLAISHGMQDLIEGRGCVCDLDDGERYL